MRTQSREYEADQGPPSHTCPHIFQLTIPDPKAASRCIGAKKRTHIHPISSQNGSFGQPPSTSCWVAEPFETRPLARGLRQNKSEATCDLGVGQSRGEKSHVPHVGGPMRLIFEGPLLFGWFEGS